MAARTVVGDGRIIAIQQPHTYSRTQQMYREFAHVLEEHADHTVMLDVYGAREDPVPGVTGELVSGAFDDPAHVHYVADWQQAADYTATVAREGDYVITLGCGNVYQIIPQVLEALAHTERHADRAASGAEPVDGTGSSPGCAGRRRSRRRRSRRLRGRRSADPGADLDEPDPLSTDAVPAAALRRRASRSHPSSRSPRRRRCSGRQGCPGRRRPSGEPPVEDAAPVRLRDVWAASRARRKALRAEVRRFTGRQRRRRAVWLGGAASVVLLVLATLGAAYSPLFAVEQIRIVGAVDLDTRAVEAALSDQLGTPLPLVDESAVKAALVTFPLVESYSLEARPPHELVVRIVERTPIGLIQTRAGYTLVDAAGVALSTTATPAPGRPVVTVQGGTDSPAFEAIGLVMRSLPQSILVQVTAVSASTPDDVTLTLGGANAQVVWGSAEDSALKALVLETTMAARPPASVLVYDVSSPSAIVVR